MLLTRRARTPRGVCTSCGVGHSRHALNCVAWWNEYRRDHFDDQRLARYRRIAWVVVTGDVCAWVLDLKIAAAALLALSIAFLGAVAREHRKPIA
jgi:hypothetical protein